MTESGKLKIKCTLKSHPKKVNHYDDVFSREWE